MKNRVPVVIYSGTDSGLGKRMRTVDIRCRKEFAIYRSSSSGDEQQCVVSWGKLAVLVQLTSSAVDLSKIIEEIKGEPEGPGLGFTVFVRSAQEQEIMIRAADIFPPCDFSLEVSTDGDVLAGIRDYIQAAA